jgi:hypothetical protein
MELRREFCPLREDKLCNEECAWFCVGDKMCAVKVIAVELIKEVEGI